MLLIDSSVWIDWLRGSDTGAVRFLLARESQEEIALTQMICLEVLQGVSSQRQFSATRTVLGAVGFGAAELADWQRRGIIQDRLTPVYLPA